MINIGSIFEGLESVDEQLQQIIPLPYKQSDVCTSYACHDVDDQEHQSTHGGVSDVTSTQEGTLRKEKNRSSQISTEQILQCEIDECTAFIQRTCGCKHADGKPCSTLFPLEHYINMRAQVSLLSHHELDLLLLGSIMTTIENHDETSVRGRHKPLKRKRITSHYMHEGYHVCTKTYAFLYGIEENHRLKALKKHYLENGVEPRVYKNTKRLPPRAATYDEIVALMTFLQNYAEANAILLPGRIPSYKRDDLKLLPSDTSKKVYKNNH